jgi:hypothetical protein
MKNEMEHIPKSKFKILDMSTHTQQYKNDVSQNSNYFLSFIVRNINTVRLINYHKMLS